MKNNIKEAYEKIKAEEALKNKTLDFISKYSTENPTQPWAKKIIFPLAVSMTLMLVCIGGFRYYFTATTYLSLDVNPSIELSLNAFDKVVAATPYNEDGTLILDNTEVLHLNYKQALEVLLEEETAQNYLKEDNYILITLQAENVSKEEVLQNSISGLINTHLTANNATATTEIRCVNAKIREEAHNQHLSTGRYMAIQDLQSADPSLSFDECAAMSMGEMKRMQGQHGQKNQNGGGQGQGQGHRHGHGN